MIKQKRNKLTLETKIANAMGQKLQLSSSWQETSITANCYGTCALHLR